MKYKLKKETKPTLATFGRYKAVASYGQTIGTRQIIEEVSSHESLSEGTVTAVMMGLSYFSCFFTGSCDDVLKKFDKTSTKSSTKLSGNDHFCE